MERQVEALITNSALLDTLSTNPYHNLGLEEYLLGKVRPGTCLFYLWQNRHTVVIGKNQNAWKECQVGLLTAEEGFLARRISGGGAVYQDMGNLCFTFIMAEEDYDLHRQTRVILKAVEALGIQAEMSGRNDLTVDGKKFSGNAFYHGNGMAYQHGTLLVNVDMAKMPRYLTVDPEKIKAKGVDSVRARVTNLIDYRPDLTISLMKEKLVEAFGQVYGPPEIWREEDLERDKINALQQLYADDTFRLGLNRSFSTILSRRFPWGGVEIQLETAKGKAQEVKVYSDAMDSEFILEVGHLLRGASLTEGSLGSALEPLAVGKRSAWVADLQQMMAEEGF